MFFKDSKKKLSNKGKLGRTEYIVSYTLSVFFLLFAIYRVALQVAECAPAYSGFCIPDFMINYQGGFIRRGLLGEIMYQAFLLHPYPFHTMLIYFEAFLFIAFLFLSYHVFHKLKYIPIMPLAILVGGLVAYRRDFLMIMTAFLIFKFIIKYVKAYHVHHLLMSIGLMIVSTLVYEPSFFFIIPISIFIFWHEYPKSESRNRKIRNTILTFALPIITMMIACAAKGTSDQAETIWQSWSPLFEYLNLEQPLMPAAINFLSMSESVAKVSMFHLGINYGIGDGCKVGFNPLLVIGSLLFFFGTYYLTITTPQKETSKKTSKLLSSMFIFQFICLLPMFTILSCDFGRTIIYVVFTSFYLTYLLRENSIDLKIPFIDRITNKSINILEGSPLSMSLLIHLAVLFFIPFNIACGVSIVRPLFIYEYWPIIQPKIAMLLNMFGL